MRRIEETCKKQKKLNSESFMMRQKFINMFVRKIKKIPTRGEGEPDSWNNSDDEYFPDIFKYKDLVLGDKLQYLENLVDEL